MTDIAFLLPPGFFTSGVTGLIDAFMLANRQMATRGGPGLRWRLLSADGGPVAASSGLRLAADGSFAELRAGEVIIVPGVMFDDVASFERVLASHADLVARLRGWREAGHVLAAHCTGVALLAEAGVLDGQPATLSWWLAGWFRRRYPAVQLDAQALVTESAHILCSGATSAYQDLALKLIARLLGEDVAQVCARILLIDPNRVSQAPYATLAAYNGHNDPLVSDCQRWMHARLDQPFSLAALAAAVHSSERTLMRRFRQALGDTPLRHLQQQRLFAARRLLETTTLDIGEIALRVGYQDTGAFRKLFTRELHCAPAEYRRRFARVAG